MSILVATIALSPAAAGATTSTHGPEGQKSPIFLSVSSLYSVKVAPGSWVPVTVAVANRGQSDMRGQLVITVPTSPLASPGGQVCYGSSSGGTVCSYSFSGGPSANYSSEQSSTLVTYKVALDLAPGTTKSFQADVLANSAQSTVAVDAVASSGRLLASTTAQLSVGNVTMSPAVLVLTDQSTTLSAMSLPMPDGTQPQVQLLAPAAAPAASAALGAFSAVLVDQADTSVLSPAQSRALQGYVEAGGTLVVAGGLSWRAAAAGFPARFLPARVEGVRSETVPQLAHLVYAAPPGPVDVDKLVPAPGSVALMTEAGWPLAEQARRGNGYVVMSALDPAAAPLAGWGGSARLVSRLLASAYQYAFYGDGATLSKGGVVSFASVVPPIFGGQGPGPTSLMSPVMASSELVSYLEEMPGASPPSAAFLGLLLLGYVVVAGPVCFVLLGRLRRRDLTWVAVPALAVLAGLAAYVTGAGMTRSPIVDEVQVAQMAPGSSLAQVSSLGAVYLPRGGSDQVTLASSGPVGDLGAGAGAELTIGAGAGPGTSALTVRGPNNSLGGWAASEDTPVQGTLDASVRASAGAMNGVVANHLGVTLTNVYVVEGSSNANLGSLAPGASVHFKLLASSSSGNGYPYPAFTVMPLGTSGAAAARHQSAVMATETLAAEYASANDGGPVLVALAQSAFLPPDTEGAGRPASTLDAVVVPLAPSEPPGANLSGLSPELVASRGSAGTSGSPGSVSTFTLAKDGFFDYQFVLPGTRWRAVRVDLGAPLGSAAATGTGAGTVTGVGFPPGTASSMAGLGFTLSAFDYRSGTWAVLAVSGASGQLLATIPHPADYVGPGGAVELRVYALAAGLELVGPVPTVSAQAGAS